jgi:hypothetical protein
MHILHIIQFPPDVNTSGRLMAQLCEVDALPLTLEDYQRVDVNTKRR